MNQWTVTFQPLTLNKLEGKVSNKKHSQNIPNATYTY